MIDLILKFAAFRKFGNCKQAYIVWAWLNVRKPTYSRLEMLTF